MKRFKLKDFLPPMIRALSGQFDLERIAASNSEMKALQNAAMSDGYLAAVSYWEDGFECDVIEDSDESIMTVAREQAKDAANGVYYSVKLFDRSGGIRKVVPEEVKIEIKELSYKLVKVNF